jgi:hypothetical protein
MRLKLIKSPVQARAARPALLARRSGNRKLGRKQTHALALSQYSCRDCDMLPVAGAKSSNFLECYGNKGLQQLAVTGRLNCHPETEPLRIARVAAKLIDELTHSKAERLPLRLFTVGDSPTVRGTRALSKAVYRYLDSSSKGQESRSWGYTHAYRRVKLSDWNPSKRSNFSILASLSSLDAKTGAELPRRTIRGLFRAALRKGYRHYSIIVQSFPAHNQPIEVAGKRFLQCPYQVEALRAKAEHRTPNGTIVCANCRGCMSSQLAKSGLDGVAFIPD